MQFFVFLITLLLTITPAWCAEELEADDTCFIKGVVGDYSYDPTSGEGPSAWGDLPGFETCGTGKAQSPIDFPTSVLYGPLSDGPKPAIGVAEMELSAGSFNWALNCPEGKDCGGTMFGGKRFNLVNLHLHAPSEHTLNGKQFAMEAHMVHAADDGQLAVIATMFDDVDESAYQNVVFAGADKEFGRSPLIGSILRALRKGKTKFPVFMGSILNPGLGYCAYVGSLTTPPCTEGVTFFMSNNVKTVTQRQVSEYLLSAGATFVDGNNRPVQPINDRDVKCYIL